MDVIHCVGCLLLVLGDRCCDQLPTTAIIQGPVQFPYIYQTLSLYIYSDAFYTAFDPRQKGLKGTEPMDVTQSMCGVFAISARR